MNKIQLTFECTPFEAQEVARLLDGMSRINELTKVPPVKVSETIITGKAMMPKVEKTVLNKEDKRKFNGIKKNRWKKKDLSILEEYIFMNSVKGAMIDHNLLKHHNKNAIYQKFLNIKHNKNEIETLLIKSPVKEYLPPISELRSTESKEPKKWFSF